MRIPRLVLAGTHSGVGKTTIATGLMAALERRGHPVQGYKVGPDYIDPSYHAAATGRPSRNLDRWLLGEHLPSVFQQSAVGNWAVIEGVMGMYDGVSGTAGYGSTADVAKILQAPILLIIDATSMSRSVAALVHGFKSFDSQVNLQGVILNRVKSAAQERMLREALEEIQVPLLGAIPQEARLRLPERHLGLVPVGERTLVEGYIEDLAQQIRDHVDLEHVEKIMIDSSELTDNPPIASENPFSRGEKMNQELKQEFEPESKQAFRLGLAWDEAFLFYYQDALDLAKRNNMTLVPFSPLHDHSLPEDLDGVFLGGGFPELHLNELGANHSFLESLRSFRASGKPIYAECGGYMYLGQSITDFNGKKVALAGLIPMQAEMTPRLQGMGYRRGVFQTDTFLGPRGTAVQGHEFHYSRVVYQEEFPAAYALFKGDQPLKMEGYAQDNLVASYLHLHFAGQPQLLKRWSANAGGMNT